MKKPTKTALITGRHGFIGQHLEQFLTNKNIDIFDLPRNYLYHPRLLEYFFKYHHPDYIFHLASYGNMAHQTNERAILEANVDATFNLLDATKDCPYTAFVNVSSSSVLLSHETMYSATKKAAEHFCNYYARAYHKPIVTVRPFSVYGPMEADFRFIPTIIRSCLLNDPMTLAPNASHDWIYIDDLINQLWRATGQIGATLNLGTGRQYKNEHVVKLIESILKKKANVVERKRLRSFDSTVWETNEPIFEEISLSIEEGLRFTVEFYKNKYNTSKGGEDNGRFTQ